MYIYTAKLSFFAILLSGSFFSCLWDYDTLLMERHRFPEIHELIAGHFVRHSEAYYRWRIEDRTSNPIEERTLEDFDDIAVAYDKLGQQDQAIQTIEEKRKRFPDKGLYQTEANLGTFLIHAGKLQQGLIHINKAIEINPEAHFGREIYQKLLVMYVIERRKENDSLPLQGKQRKGFDSFVLETQNLKYPKYRPEILAAIKGVEGMMRFGNHDSPILLEALGDLLSCEYHASSGRDDASRLAARAYLKAAIHAKKSEEKTAYRKLAETAIKMREGLSLVEVEKKLHREIEQGKSLFQNISKDEKRWIDTARDVDASFKEKYYSKKFELKTQPRNRWLPISIIFIISLMAIAMGIFFIRRQIHGIAPKNFS